jgi:hypothetical protein
MKRNGQAKCRAMAWRLWVPVAANTFTAHTPER